MVRGKGTWSLPRAMGVGYGRPVVASDGDATTSSELAVPAVEFSPDGVLVVDRSGQIKFANASIHQLVGTDASLVGSSVDDLVPERARERHGSLRAHYADDAEPRPMGTTIELSLRRADGSELPVEIALSPFDDDGLHVVATVRDVTERQRIRRQLAAADQQIALLDERERIGRDLHDVVLQRLYGTGLTVQAIGAGIGEPTRARLDDVIDEIDRIIAEVRTIVFTLGHSGPRGALGQELADIVAQASRVLGFTPALRLDGPVDSVLGDEARVEMIASMREALGNVARHAHASAVDVTVAVRNEQVVMIVRDDGVGLEVDLSRPHAGNGLANLRARAEALDGHCKVSSAPGGGAELVWAVPY